MASNAAAAVAVACTVGVDLATALEALETARISDMRMRVSTLPRGALLIDDAYNANPTSMTAALDALAASEATRRIAILGPMAELDDPAAAHAGVALYASGLGIEIIAVGTDAYGVEPVDDPVARAGELGPGDVVLVKASRAAGLERVVAELIRSDGMR